MLLLTPQCSAMARSLNFGRIWSAASTARRLSLLVRRRPWILVWSVRKRETICTRGDTFHDELPPGLRAPEQVGNPGTIGIGGPKQNVSAHIRQTILPCFP